MRISSSHGGCVLFLMVELSHQNGKNICVGSGIPRQKNKASICFVRDHRPKSRWSIKLPIAKHPKPNRAPSDKLVPHPAGLKNRAKGGVAGGVACSNISAGFSVVDWRLALNPVCAPDSAAISTYYTFSTSLLSS